MHRYPRSLILFAALLSACNLISAPAAAPTAQPPTSSPAVATLPAGNTYTDTNVGFTFVYPEGWNIITPNEQMMAEAISYVFTLQSFEPGIGSDSIPEGSSKIDVVVTPQTATTLDAIRERISLEENSGSITILSEERITLSGGFPALVIEGESSRSGAFTSVYALVNGAEIIVSGINADPLTLANSIRATT